MKISVYTSQVFFYEINEALAVVRLRQLYFKFFNINCDIVLCQLNSPAYQDDVIYNYEENVALVKNVDLSNFALYFLL